MEAINIVDWVNRKINTWCTFSCKTSRTGYFEKIFHLDFTIKNLSSSTSHYKLIRMQGYLVEAKKSKKERTTATVAVTVLYDSATS